MKTLLLSLLLAASCAANTYVCVNSAADPGAISTAIAAGGTATINGTCAMGTSQITISNAVTITGNANFVANASFNNWTFIEQVNNVTFNNLTFTNAGVWINTAGVSGTAAHDIKRSNVNFTNCTFQHFNTAVSGAAKTSAIHVDPIWQNSVFTSNTLTDIWYTGYPNINNKTTTSWWNLQNTDAYAMHGLFWFGGLDNVRVEFNSCSNISGNCFKGFDNGLSSKTNGYQVTSGNAPSISYNTFSQVHRIGIEWQNQNGSCTGGCNGYGIVYALTKVAGNYWHTPAYTYNVNFCLSLPVVTVTSEFINNFCSRDVIGNPTPNFNIFGYGLEMQPGNGTGGAIVAGGLTVTGDVFEADKSTVCSSGGASCGWEAAILTYATTGTQAYINNYFCGPDADSTAIASQSNQSVLYNYRNSTSCPAGTGASLYASNISSSVFTSANNQSFPSGGFGTWTVTNLSNLPIRNVSFYVDGQPTATVIQEIVDQNTSFSSDQKWHYHATFDTTPLAAGGHTIQEVTTDVSGATASATQQFTANGSGSSPVVTLSPTSLVFGSIATGASSISQTIVLTNTGTATLTISALTINGANAGDFSKTTTCGGSVSGGGTCNIAVTFTPTTTGARSAQVSITDNAAGSPHTVAISGTGVTPGTCTGLLNNCAFTSGSTGWSLAVGNSTSSWTQDGTGPGGVTAAHITATTVPNPFNPNLELYQQGLTIMPNTQYMVTFNGRASRAQPVCVLVLLQSSPFTNYGMNQCFNLTTAAQNFTYTFTSSSAPIAGQARYTTQMNSVATGDQFFITNISLIPGAPISTLAPTSLDFGSSNPVGSPTSAMTVTVTNVGNANLTVTPTLTGSYAADYGLTNGCTGNIAPAANCTLSVIFTPTVTNPEPAAINIVTNDSGSPYSVPLTGAGSITGQLGTITYQDRLGVVSTSPTPTIIHFGQFDDGTEIPVVSYAKNRVLNASGSEVPWQFYSDGTIGTLPSIAPSKIPYISPALAPPNGNNFIQISQPTVPTLCLANNTPVKFFSSSSGALPAPLTSGTIYYLSGCTPGTGVLFYSVLPSVGGTKITFTSSGANYTYFKTLGFSVSGSTFTYGSHGYHNGDQIEYETGDNGVLPTGLLVDTPYFVCNAATDTYQLSVNSSCSPLISTSNSGTTDPVALSTIIYTVKSGNATTATTTNSPTFTNNGTGNWELTNGLTGARVPTVAAMTTASYGLAPIQGIQFNDGTWSTAGSTVHYDTKATTILGGVSTTASTPNGYSLKVTEQGLLEVKVQSTTSVKRGVFSGSSPVASVGSVFGLGVGIPSGGCNSLPCAQFATQVRFIYVTSGNSWISSSTAYAVVGGSSYSCPAASSGYCVKLKTLTGTPVVPTGGDAFTATWALLQVPDASGCTALVNCGFYTLTLDLTAGSKGFQVLEDHDTHVYTYSVPTINKLTANQVRFRALGGNPLSSAQPVPYCAYNPVPISVATTNGTTMSITTATPLPFISAGYYVALRGITGLTGYTASPTILTAGGVDSTHLNNIACSGCSGSYSGTGAYVEIWANTSGTKDEAFDLGLSGVNRISGSNGNWGNGCTANSPIVPLASQYGPNSGFLAGWEEVAVNTAGSSSSPAIGIALGDPGYLNFSEATMRGPGFYDHPDATADQGISFWDFSANGAASYYTGESKMASMVWVSTNTDVPAWNTYVQPIMLTHNVIAGINQNHFSNYNLDFPSPPAIYAPPFLSPLQNAFTINLLNNSGSQTAICGSSGCLSNAVAQDGTQRNEQIATIMTQGGNHPQMEFQVLGPNREILSAVANQWLNGQGQFDNATSGYQAWSEYANCTNQLPQTVQAIGSATSITAYDESALKSNLSFCSQTIYDPQFQTSDPSVSFGNANTILSYQTDLIVAAIFGAYNPSFSTNGKQQVQSAYTNLLSAVNPFGAGFSSWHYQGAGTNVPLNIWVGLSNQTNIPTGSFSKIQNFGTWYLSGLTPPEVRYGQTRKYVSNGDGNTEAEPDPGLLATIIYPYNPSLGSKIMSGYMSQGMSGLAGGNLGNFFVAQLLTQDFSIPKVTLALTSQHISGYHSMLRSNFGTNHENAVDFLYGGYYSAQGHAHHDTGRVAMYLLGAPISIDWNANLYYPGTPGRFDHSSVVLDSEFGSGNWLTARPCCGDNSVTGLDIVSSTWSGSSPDNTVIDQSATFTNSQSATAHWTKTDGTVWTRQVTLFNADPNFAVVHVYDSFTGAQASAAKTITWNLMSGGVWSGNNTLTSWNAVTTPSGSITPVMALNINDNSVYPPVNSPTNTTPPYTLNGTGLSEFSFSGQNWTAYPGSSGVDFDFYTQDPAGNSNTWTLSAWCDSENNNNQFGCKQEAQSILRIHTNVNAYFDSTIVARVKSTTDPTVTQQSCGTQVVSTGGTLCFDQHHSTFTAANGTETLATYDSTSETAFGITISGAAAEAVLTSGSLVVTTSGWTGANAIVTLPAGYYPIVPVALDGSGHLVLYSDTAIPATVTFSNTPATVRTVSITAPTTGGTAKLQFAGSITSATPYLTSGAAGSTVLLSVPSGTYSYAWTTANGTGTPTTLVVQ